MLALFAWVYRVANTLGCGADDAAGKTAPDSDDDDFWPGQGVERSTSSVLQTRSGNAQGQSKGAKYRRVHPASVQELDPQLLPVWKEHALCPAAQVLSREESTAVAVAALCRWEVRTHETSLRSARRQGRPGNFLSDLGMAYGFHSAG